MAKRPTKEQIELPPIPLETNVDVFRFKDSEIVKTTMPYGEYLKMTKQVGYFYAAFKVGDNTTIPTKTVGWKR